MVTTTERRPRPANLRDPGNPYAAAYDWLEANGIDEWLPEHPSIVVEHHRRRLSYLAFVFDRDRRGWDPDDLLVVAIPGRPDTRTCATHWRTVPLLVPPTPAVLDLFAVAGVAVIELGKPDPNRARLRAMHTAYRRRRRR